MEEGALEINRTLKRKNLWQHMAKTALRNYLFISIKQMMKPGCWDPESIRI